MRHSKLLLSTFASILFWAPSVSAQSFFENEDYRPYIYKGELSQEGWILYRNRIENTPIYDFTKYDRDKYRDLQNTLADAEANCFNAGDLMGEDAAEERFYSYLRAYEDLYKLYKAENTPEDVKRAFETEYLDENKRPKLLKGCPPSKKLRTQDEIGIPLQSEIFQKKLWKDMLAGATAAIVSQDVPSAGYGFRSTGTGETYAGRSNARFGSFRIGAYLARLRESEDLDAEPKISADGIFDVVLGLTYEEGDGVSTAQVENGTDNTGIVYHNNALNGSTGVAIGNRGLDVHIKTEYSALDVYANKFLPANGEIKPYVGIKTSFSETTHVATISTPSFSDISSISTQKIDNDIVAAVVGAQTGYDLGNKLTFNAQAEVSAGALFSSLDSEQTNQCGLCATDERNFLIATEDSRTKLAVGGKASVSVLLEVLEGVHVGPRVQAEWQNKVGYPRNPESGDDLFLDNNPTHLEFDDKLSYQAAIEAYLTF